MKNIFTLFFIILSILVYSQDWKLISTEDEEATFYKPNTDATAWIKTVSKKTEYYPKNSKTAKVVDGFSMLLFKFDCAEKKMGLLQYNIYSKAGKVLDHKEIEDVFAEMDYVIPETKGEHFFNVFCSKEN